MNDPNLPSIKQDSSAENNNSGNMYSYRDENNINNPKELESGAIRRSIGEGNPNADFPKPSFNPAYVISRKNGRKTFFLPLFCLF